MAAEQDHEYAELPTEAPRTGPLSPLPAPLLTGVPTGLPGMRADGGLLRGRWIAAASLTGTSHLLHGTSGQDVYRYTATHDGSGLVLVVCDGLGSRPETAQTGAGLLASYLCEAAAHITGQLMARAPQDVLREVLATGNAAVRRHRAAVLEPLTDSDLASTVAVCWLPLPAEGDGDGDGGSEEYRALPGHAVRVGDCNVFTLAGGRYEAPFPAACEGPANVVTAYLPCEDAARVAEYAPVALAGVDAVVVTTDGLAIDLFDSPSVRTWLASRWSVPCGPARMLDSLRYRRQGSHDDRTALITWSAPVGHTPRLEP
ncbi:protein phosphatase 2C domain-containing protein [Streptomyces goshikiensis]|uniref:protein phosphatase 2C domain-containing protein n=1 Tax=Streptomyces goshikiensis TaxID=1942 RepID=UPI0036525069